MPKKSPITSPLETPASKSPNWVHWENLATVNLREALQLSLGLDPHTHNPASEQDMALREQYWNRLLISKNHAPTADWVIGGVAREDGDISPEYTEVHLKKFAEWIVNDTTLEPFPIEFCRLVKNEATSRLVVDKSVHEESMHPNLQTSTVTPKSSRRRDLLTPAIEQAQSQCTNPNDAAEVWNVLFAGAQQNKQPFIGVAHEGLKYLDTHGDVQFFSKDALGKRLNRQR